MDKKILIFSLTFFLIVCVFTACDTRNKLTLVRGGRGCIVEFVDSKIGTMLIDDRGNIPNKIKYDKLILNGHEVVKLHCVNGSLGGKWTGIVFELKDTDIGEKYEHKIGPFYTTFTSFKYRLKKDVLYLYEDQKEGI